MRIGVRLDMDGSDHEGSVTGQSLTPRGADALVEPAGER